MWRAAGARCAAEAQGGGVIEYLEADALRPPTLAIRTTTLGGEGVAGDACCARPSTLAIGRPRSTMIGDHRGGAQDAADTNFN
jgi:hypothetical protein